MKKKNIIISVLLVVEVISIFLAWQSSSASKTLDKVTEENKINKQQFAMYVQKEKDSEDYEVLTTDAFPDKLKYILNINRSECQDNNGNKIENNEEVISTNNDGKITVTSTKTIYCTFYFDLEKTVPSITEFHIGTQKGEEYTNKTTVPFHIEWTDDDIDKYCLTTESSSEHCDWQDKGVTTISVDDNHKVDGTTTLSADNTYTYYAYLKDLAGNESAAASDQITLDTQVPTVTIGAPNSTVIKSGGKATYTVTVSKEVDLNSSKIPTLTGSNNLGTVAITSNNGSKTEYTATATGGTGNGAATLTILEGTFTDKAGNINAASTRTGLTIDNTISQPSITGLTGTANSTPTPSSGYTHSTAVKVTGSWSDTDITHYCLSNSTATTSCNWQTAPSTKTITNISHTIASGQGSKTVYLFVKDQAGNISTSGNKTITYDTTNPTPGTMSSSLVTQNSFRVTVNDASDTGYSGAKISKYCFKKSTETSWNNASHCGTSASKDYTGLTAGSSTIINAKVIDVSGREAALSNITVVTLKPANQVVTEAKPTGLQSTPGTGDLTQRFVGETVNNYICIDGTSCNTDSDMMYRIIGITSSGQLKVMKNKSIGDHDWSKTNSDVKWNASEMKRWLNAEGFLNSTTQYIPDALKSKIVTPTWNIGTVGAGQYEIGSAVLTAEQATKDSTGKIGLMYLSDVYYVYNDGKGTQNCTKKPYCVSWMLIDPGGNALWTMTYRGLNIKQYQAWQYRWGGVAITMTLQAFAFKTNPVFYLDSSVKITGSGKTDDPFKVTV